MSSPHHGMLLQPLPQRSRQRSVLDVRGQIDDRWDFIEDTAQPGHGRFCADLSGYQVQRLSGTNANSWLDQFSLALVGQLCENLGMALLHSKKRSIVSCTPEEVAIATEFGFNAARKGPTGIQSALRQARRGSATAGSTFSSDFLIFYTWLKRIQRAGIDCGPILEAVAQFSFEEYSFDAGERFLGRVCPERQNYCPASLARDYGLNIVIARKILRELQCDFRPYKIPMVKADHTIPIVERFCRSLLPYEAERALGVDRVVLARLVEKNLLSAPLQIPDCNERYDSFDISQFQQKMFSHSDSVDIQSEGFASLRALRTMYSVRLDTMCQWICSGSMTRVEHCKCATSFQDITLNIEEVRSKLAQSQRPDFSKTDLKSILHINDTTVAYLVREKLISGERLKNNFNNKVEHRFWAEDIDGFLQKYVPLGLLAKTLFMQPFAVQQRLANDGILPLEIPKKCNRIFWRNDLTDELRRAPLDWRSLVRESALP
ncbi:hypothetical protein MWU60_19400 [Yoonia sp. F2084L]|uniref:hypothetical protein n=1 Tax=Yoonia sp. F2084L TaxID=2926419 RepID=UPI001FF4BD6A|nr:hypothetical protein [Yoonia sp. F2084L]MCK0097748.1 hypothetical protein [Yoonia sp. F2084L]